MSRNRDALDSFGKELIAKVYDDALAHLKRVIEGKMRGQRSVELGQLYGSLDARSAEVVRRFMSEAVDATFSRFLNFFDEQDLPLHSRTSDGNLVDVRRLSDGLAAEPYTDAGWIEKYSNFKDLVDPLK